jgi:hypothetical protein
MVSQSAAEFSKLHDLILDYKAVQKFTALSDRRHSTSQMIWGMEEVGSSPGTSQTPCRRADT